MIQRKHDVDDDHDDSHADDVAMDLSQRQNSSSMSHPKHPIHNVNDIQSNATADIGD